MWRSMLHIQVQGASPLGAAAASGRAEPGEGAGAVEAGEAAEAAVDRNVRIFSGNPLVRTLRGTVRLFLDAPGRAAAGEEAGNERGGSRLVCIFAVPSYMSAPELLDFVGRDLGAVEQVRIVRDSQPSRFLALLQFQSPEAADAFLQRVNGHPFNSIEPERCHAYFAETVQFVDEEGAVQSTHVGSLDRRVPADPLGAFPLGKDTVRELPKCPVCLERLDTDVSGVVTTMCNHTCALRRPMRARTVLTLPPAGSTATACPGGVTARAPCAATARRRRRQRTRARRAACRPTCGCALCAAGWGVDGTTGGTCSGITRRRATRTACTWRRSACGTMRAMASSTVWS